MFDFQALANDVKEMFDVVRQDTLVDGSTRAESSRGCSNRER